MVNEAFGSDLPPNNSGTGKSVAELLQQEEYRPRELAMLLDLPETVIEHDAYSGRLKAYIVDDDIISIRREDALAWMESRT